MTQSMVIPRWVPEQLANGPQGNWRDTWRKKKDAAKMAYLSAKAARWAFIPGRVFLEITYVFPVKRKRDPDGLVSRSKGLVDGLKAFFTDDDTEHLELRVHALVERGVKETRVLLYSLEGM